MAKRSKAPRIDLEPGRILLGKYEVMRPLGKDWERVSYLLQERSTRIEWAGELSLPSSSPADGKARRCARKLHRLERCRMPVDDTTWEQVETDGVDVTLLVSELVRGQPLNECLPLRTRRRPYRFDGQHSPHSLARGVAGIHRHREHRDDLHDLNIIVERFGPTCDLRPPDLFDRGACGRQRVEDCFCDIVGFFCDAIGGRVRSAGHPPYLETICCGLEEFLIIRRFHSARGLLEHLESLELAQTAEQETTARLSWV